MADFAFYTGEYGGTRFSTEAELLPYATRAAALLDNLERSYTVVYPAPTSRSKALCALADEAALTANALCESEGNVRSVSAGSVSTSYAGLSPALLVQNAAGRYYRTLQTYAEVYRGARRKEGA